MPEHGKPADRMERFWQGRFHARAFAGRENHNRGGSKICHSGSLQFGPL